MASTVEKTPLVSGRNAAEIVSSGSRDESFHGQQAPATTKSISNLGSFSLLINNLIGPAMLGFPNLFQKNGLVPSILCIVFIYVCASLCGTLLADAISSIPGNRSFTRNVDFSSAFRLVMGEDWYIIAEALFLVCCVVQAVAGIVETAQSIDGFFASILLGRTYALQLSPQVELISWEPTRCQQATDLGLESSLEDCTPFNEAGSFIISLGFICTTALFLPLGRGNLQETIGVQLVAFGCMIVLLSQFAFEFVGKGFPYEVPLFTPNISNLAGFVLFNYAFIITVPAWLCEKRSEVSVNKLVWGASSLASFIYIGFGVMGAMTFQSIGTNALVLLTSSKVHAFTRVCAAFFGVSIIGSGVPVLCVIIRTAIFHTKLCSFSWSLFLGSVMPYLVCWTLYQGTALSVLLAWTGLIVNGSVAFLLPLLLVLRALTLQRRAAKRESLGGALELRSPLEARESGLITGPNSTTLSTSGEAASPTHFSQQLATNGGVSVSNSGGVDTTDGSSSSFRGWGWFGGTKHRRTATAVSGATEGSHSTTVMDSTGQDNAAGAVDDEAALLGKSPCPPGLRSEQYSEAGRVSTLEDTTAAESTHFDIARSISNESTTGVDSSSGLFEDRVRPLPTILEPYRKHIVVAMVVAFSVIIIVTIVNDLFMGSVAEAAEGHQTANVDTRAASAADATTAAESLSLAAALRRQYRTQQQQLYQQQQQLQQHV